MPAELPEPVKAAETRKPEFGIGAEKVFRAHDPKADPVATAGPRGFGAGWAPGPAGGRSGRERARPEPDLRGPTLQSPSVQPDTRSSPYQPGPRGERLLHPSSRPLRTARCALRVRRPLLPTAGWRRYFSERRSHRRSAPARTERAAGSKIALTARALLATRLASPRHSPLGLIARSTRLFASAVNAPGYSWGTGARARACRDGRRRRGGDGGTLTPPSEWLRPFSPPARCAGRRSRCGRAAAP